VEPVNVCDYERLAAERLEPGAFGYFAGGANDELTLADNVAAYRRWQLRPRVLVDVSEPSTATTVLGHEVSMPLLVAPVAFQRVAHPDGEVAMGRAVAGAGTVMCVSTMATATWDEIAATGVPRWFQLYVPRDEGVAAELIGGAAAHGFTALVLTVDTPVLGRRERDLRTGFSIEHLVGLEWLNKDGLNPRNAFESISAAVTWADVERFASLSGLPVVLKGIVTAEDARLACEHGAAAVIVSNHGGRQLDGVSATIDALPEVAEAIDGRIEVMVDGGIRRGTDVVKALGLGARAVLAGRAPLWGLTLDGEEGVRRVLELLRAEIQLALQLVGCRTPADVTRAHVSSAPVR
jgi:isopentenyl diphosphate isomerase/L-lactate dehydrogenase-like FMN-dependent dehydrogenase